MTTLTSPQRRVLRACCTSRTYEPDARERRSVDALIDLALVKRWGKGNRLISTLKGQLLSEERHG